MTVRLPLQFWQFVTIGYLGLLHVAFAVAVLRGPSAGDWWLMAAMFAAISFGCTVGLHRYFAHRSFKTSRAFGFVMALCAGAAFGDPIAFSARHRRHHAESDTEHDVHSPNQGWFHCWFGTLLDYRLEEAQMARLVPDLVALPELRWLHRFFFLPGVITIAATAWLGGPSAFAIGYCGACLLVVHAGSAVNYFGHLIGTRPYATNDRSTNHPVLALISLGEGWHNNHHYYPAACRAGFQWWQIDILYYEIKILSWLGLVWDLNEVPDRVRLHPNAQTTRVGGPGLSGRFDRRPAESHPAPACASTPPD
jgi:stearoyl-CoA desaturase (delta-9 desaturase)